jgi:hypothetical protein
MLALASLNNVLETFINMIFFIFTSCQTERVPRLSVSTMQIYVKKNALCYGEFVNKRFLLLKKKQLRVLLVLWKVHSKNFYILISSLYIV